MAEQIIVTVDVLGRVKIDAQGFHGKSCTEAIEQIEIALGGMQQRKEKPEFYAPPNSTAAVVKNAF